jgi:polyisoprenoid-binding protein YceI
MKGFQNPFTFLHKNVSLVIILDIRYLDIDKTDIGGYFHLETKGMTTITNTTLAPAQTSTTTWNVDPAHSVAEFKVKHMMISNVKGRFSKLSGALVFDESDLANSRVEVSIDAASIQTGEEQRDARLKSADFFDVEKFPTLAFKSEGIRIVRDGELSVEGGFTIRGVTQKVSFAVEGPTPPSKDPWGNTRVAISASPKINRKDFGLTWNAALETGSILVGEEVTITLDTQFVKA